VFVQVERAATLGSRRNGVRRRTSGSAADTSNGAGDASRLNQLLAVVAHELRAPAHAILGWSSLLADDRRAAGATRQRARDAIKGSAQLLCRLVDDLLDRALLERGQMRLSFDEVDLVLIARAAVDAVRPAAKSKGVEVVDQMTDTLPIMGDAGRLQQVVANLLSNAIKFTPSAGHVTLSARRAGRWRQLIVSDSGPGIDPAMRSSIFEPFRRGRGVVDGLGLGLNIARSIVEMHNGRIYAESSDRGGGAKFIVEFPDRLARRPNGGGGHVNSFTYPAGFLKKDAPELQKSRRAT
jgi:signal transduction histidine kinase